MTIRELIERLQSIEADVKSGRIVLESEDVCAYAYEACSGCSYLIEQVNTVETFITRKGKRKYTGKFHIEIL